KQQGEQRLRAVLGVRSWRKPFESRRWKRLSVIRSFATAREAPVFRGIMHDRQADLPEIIGTPCTAGRLTDALNRRQQQADEHTNDGHDDEKLDQRECACRLRARRPSRHSWAPP